MENNRTDWEFDYPASSISMGAKRQREYRDGRVQWWEARKAEVMEKIKTSGLTVHEGVGANLSYSNTSNQGAQVMVDATLQRDLNECVTKIRSHQAAVKEYDAWIQVLDANPQARLKLKHGDWIFFFGT